MYGAEPKKKARGLFIALAVLFAVSLLIGAITVARRHGGDVIADVVKSSLKSSRVIPWSDQKQAVSDYLTVAFRENTTEDKKREIAGSVGAKIEWMLLDRPGGYLIRFKRPATAKEIREVIEYLQAKPDVLLAEPLIITGQQ